MTGGDQIRFPRLYLHLFASAACVLPVASYLLSALGWGPADIGVGTAALGVAGTVASPFWGWLDDHTGWAPRAAMLASAAAAGATALTLGRLPHPATWAGLALFGATQGSLDALLTTRILESGVHGRRLGRIRAYGSLGWVLGLAAAASVLTVWPDHAPWVFLTAAVLAATAPRSWGSRSRNHPADGSAAGSRAPVPVRPVLGVLAFTFPTAVVMSAVVQFTAGWAHEVLVAGPFLALTPIALSAALELPAFPWVDRMAHRYPALLLAVLAGPPLAVSTAALALVPSAVVMIAVQPLIAVSFALLFVGQSRMLARSVDAGRQASAQTLGAALSTGFGGLLAGTVGGRLAQAAGYGGLFAALGVIALVGVVPGVVALARSRHRLAADLPLR